VGTLLSGSTSAGAIFDAPPSCGEASIQTTPGSWYTITGNGQVITASTCTGTYFDSQLSVFTGASCSQLTCVDGNDDACGDGFQSRVDFQSNQGQTYFVVVHGVFEATGNFDLQIIPAGFTSLFDLFVNFKVSSQALEDPTSPQYAALDWMTNNDSTPDLQSPLSHNWLVERFVLVLFYFSTDGASWLDQAGFLTSSLNTCAWNSIVGLFGPIGVGCNDEGSLDSLSLCKFPNSSFST
jgi:hypothetical protein